VVESTNRGINQINVGRTLLDVSRTATELGLYVPSELSVLGKTLLQLDEVGKILDPGFDPNAAVRRNATEIMTKRVHRDATSGSAMKALLDMKDFIAGLPERLNKIMDAVGDGAVEVNVRATDANLFMEGLQKIANRITSGIVLAALIIGASLLMRVDTDFRLLGYPGLAMLCFMAAAAGGVWLLATIYAQDRRESRRPNVRKTV
jgi:predicted unusual protein kinase regulating ubiquinone biosynthesis (AarF/ABC1/UbiB family)